MYGNTDERRTDQRLAMERPVKVYDPRGRRYLPARTLNVSPGGLLVEMRGGSHLPAGAAVEVAIDWAGSTGLLSQGDLLPATIVRRGGVNGSSTYLALRFAARQSFALAA